MSDNRDIYEPLRPTQPTPEDELCSCPPGTPIKLMWRLSKNPIACMNCNGEVPPENVPVPEDMVSALAYWCHIDAAIESLELDSGAYEQWAQAQLLDPQNWVVTEGREMQGWLDPIRRCYYSFFQPISYDDDPKPRETCPICGQRLTEYTEWRFVQHLCEKCSVVITGQH